MVLSLPPIRKGASRIVEVGDDEIAAAMQLLYETTHNTSEGAGAAAVALAMQEQDRLTGKRVGMVLTGGNIDRELFADVLCVSTRSGHFIRRNPAPC